MTRCLSIEQLYHQATLPSSKSIIKQAVARTNLRSIDAGVALGRLIELPGVRFLEIYIEIGSIMSLPGLNDPAFGDLLLLPAEQDLLLAALNSNGANGRVGKRSQAIEASSINSLPLSIIPNSEDLQKFSGRGIEPYLSPLQHTRGTGSLDNFGIDESPYLEFDVDDAHYEWDLQEGQLTGDLPGTSISDEEAEHNEKRKGHEEEPEDGGRKRHEGEEKLSKKPGRKLLTSEPTSVGAFLSLHH